MQGREHEVTGLRRGDRSGDRLEVAHLADQDHVRILAQRGGQRVGEASRIGAELALVDDALLMPVEKLDRVLDRHDVLFAALVDHIDQRGEGGRLARAGWPGDEHEAARFVEQIAHR